jgi:membrane protease YdiL (CAAX protease family)
MNEINRQNYPSILQSFGIVGMVFISMACFIPLNYFLNHQVGKEISMLVYYILSTGVPAFIIYFIRKKKVGEVNINLNIGNRRVLVLALVGTIALLLGIISPIVTSIPMPESFKKVFLELGKMNGFVSILLAVLAAPILEEFIFRGIVLDGLLKRYSPMKSILVSSLLFGLVHLNPWQFITGFTMGVFIGYVYLNTRSLLLAMLMHSINNLIGTVQMQFTDMESILNKTLIEMYGGLINLIIAIVGSVLVFAVCMYYLKIEFKKLEPLVQNSPIDIPLTDQN